MIFFVEITTKEGGKKMGKKKMKTYMNLLLVSSLLLTSDVPMGVVMPMKVEAATVSSSNSSVLSKYLKKLMI